MTSVTSGACPLSFQEEQSVDVGSVSTAAEARLRASARW